MDGPLPGKNEGKGKWIDFKTLVVPKDEDNVFMLSPAESVPTLLPIIYSNKESRCHQVIYEFIWVVRDGMSTDSKQHSTTSSLRCIMVGTHTVSTVSTLSN